MRRLRIKLKLPAFSLVELLASAVILSILAVMGVPYAQTAKDRQVELQLKESLLKIRQAIDLYAYNEYPDDLFPKSIDNDNIRGEDPAGDADGDGIADDDWDGNVDEDGAPLFPPVKAGETGRDALKKLVDKGYLPTIPRDPLYPDNSADPADQWATTLVTRKFTFVNPDGTKAVTEITGLVDVHSRSKGIGLTGTPYASW